MAAIQASLNIMTFGNVSDFLIVSGDFQKSSTKIFIDYELDDGLFGTIEAEKIYLEGFEDITLATGHQADSLNIPSYIKNVIGKRPQF